MSYLDRILERTRIRLARQRASGAFDSLQDQIASVAPAGSFRNALRGEGLRLIAEAKKASPSRGLFRDAYDPVALAQAYERGGASALSILTEPEFFLGAPEHLQNVAKRTSLPILRKDFVVDVAQIYEAKLWGASAVLLIVAALEPGELHDFHMAAEAMGLEALVEVHDERELEIALGCGATIVGVNTRNLKTFEVDLGATERVARLLPRHCILVAESGITGREDVQRVERAGAHAVLVGEFLVRAMDPEGAVRRLLGTEGGAPT